MKGLAQTLFEQREGLSSAPTYLQQLINKGLFSEIDGFFAKCLLKDDANEEQMLFLAALLWSSRQGHLCLPLEEKELLALFASFGEESKRVTEMIRKGGTLPIKGVCRFEEFCYLQKNWLFETHFLTHLENLLMQPSKAESPQLVKDLTDEQQNAVSKALSRPLSVLCGGPGTGKTFTAARIVRAFLERWPEARVSLAAPTGKAAKQLQTQLSGEKIQVSTLHALLGVHKESDFLSDAPCVLADLLIVDECSMIDARLFSYLLGAIQPGTHLVLMGDPYQLPPVEAGSLFADLIEVLRIKSPESLSSLTQWLRSDRQEILRLAEAVKLGEGDKVWKLLSQSGSEALKYVELGDASVVLEDIWKMASTHFPQPSSSPLNFDQLWADKEHFGLLSCLRRGPFGVDALNAWLAERFISQIKEGDTLALPILITRSSEDLDLRNGETGILIRHASRSGDFALFGPAPFKRVPFSLLPPHEYAYCLSVHKSQGSEYEHVFLIAPPGSEYFGREIIYTGATRSKKSLKIISNQEVLLKALSHASRKISALHARLQKKPLK